MPGELERLLIRLEADTALFRKEMATADKLVGTFSTNVDKRLSAAEKRFASAGASFVGSIKGLAAGFGAAQLASAAFKALEKAGEIDDLARNAALGSEAFQELAYGARQAGIEQEAFAKSTQKFAVNMAELRANTGGFNAFLKDHLPTLQEQLKHTDSQGEAYRVVANAVAVLGREEDKTALAMAAFGRQGADLVEVLQEGAAGLDDMADAARRHGAVLDGETTAAAAQLKKEYDALATQIETTWMRGVVAVGRYVSAVTKALSIAASLGAQNAGPAGVVAYLEAQNTVGGWEPTVTRAKPGGATSLIAKPERRDTSGLDALLGLDKQAAAAQQQRLKVIQMEHDQEVAKFKQMLDDKKISEEDFTHARQQLGIIQSAQVSEELKRQTEEYRAQFAEVEGLITNTFMGTFRTALQGGEVSAKEFFATLAQGFAEIAVQMLVLKPLFAAMTGGIGGGMGGGMLAGIFDGIFGGPRAAGGPAYAGKAHLVGERGPELFVPNTAGRVLSNRQTAGMSGTVNNIIDARGADIGVAERIERALAMSERSRKEPVSAVGGYQRRHPYRGQ